MTPTHQPPAANLTSRDFWAVQRGGGIWSEHVNQRLAADIALVAYRRGVHPSFLTLGNLVVGTATSIGVIASSESGPSWAIGMLALLGWQLAYCLDCADGQLARVAGRTSLAGARLDLFCDLAVHVGLVIAVATVAVREPIHVFWITLFAATWTVSLFTSALSAQDAGGEHSLIRSSGRVVRVLKLTRDYGLQIAVIGILLTVVPGTMPVLVVVFGLGNALFLLATIGREFQLSVRER